MGCITYLSNFVLDFILAILFAGYTKHVCRKMLKAGLPKKFVDDLERYIMQNLYSDDLYIQGLLIRWNEARHESRKKRLVVEMQSYLSIVNEDDKA